MGGRNVVRVWVTAVALMAGACADAKPEAHVSALREDAGCQDHVTPDGFTCCCSTGTCSRVPSCEPASPASTLPIGSGGAPSEPTTDPAPAAGGSPSAGGSPTSVNAGPIISEGPEPESLDPA